MALYKSKSWSIDDEVNSKKKKNINKILISINIIGSSGPLTIVVNEVDAVCDVIDKVLKIYAHQERLPILKSDASECILHCPNDVFDGKIF
ncbi:hypothetical protein RYX36_006397 [Vicia faba]